jgi:hypothetical protein
MAKFAFNAVAMETQESLDREYRFSIFDSVTSKTPKSITLTEFREGIETGEYSDQVSKVRAITDKKARDEVKRKILPCITVSGEFDGGHLAADLKQHSGLICIDFDLADNPQMYGQAESWRDSIAEDQFCRMAFVSASGNGVAAICRIDGERHGEAFDALTAYFRGSHGLIADPSCRDVCRLRFVSWDSDCKTNPNARIFTRYSLAQKESETPAPALVQLAMAPERRAEIASALEVMIPDNRQQWLDVGMAIQSENATLAGFNLWREWSEFNDCGGKFNEKDLARVWKSIGKRGGITIATLFKMAHEAGWKEPKDLQSFSDSITLMRADQWLQVVVPRPDALIEQLIDAGTYCELIAPSKCRKSFFALNLACCLASGRKFLNWTVPRPRRVLLINIEIQPDREHDRLSMVTTAIGMKPEELGNLAFANLRGIELRNPLDAICQLMLAERFDLVIIDPLYLIHGEDESDQKAMTVVFNKLQVTQKRAGCALLVVHHDAKGKAGDRDKRDRGSGTSVMGRFSDTRIILTPHQEAPDDLICVETIMRNYKTTPGFVVNMETGSFTTSEVMVAPEKSSRKKTTKYEEVKTDSLAAVIKRIQPMHTLSTTDVATMFKEFGVRGNSVVADLIKELRTRIDAAGGDLDGIKYVHHTGTRYTFHGTAFQPEEKPAINTPYKED